MPGPAHRRPMARSTATAAFVTLAVLTGCGQQAAPPAPEDSSGPQADEDAAHRGQVCPKKLPQAPGSSHGFGTSAPADSAPSLRVPESAWVCRYVPTDLGPGPDGDGTTFGWVREGAASRVAKRRLPALAKQLTELVPAEDDRACTADLGPRRMLVYATGTDLTGVVVDDFGCHDIRLTDEPFRTVPGEAAQGGTVPGVLTDPTGGLTRLVADAAPEPAPSPPAP